MLVSTLPSESCSRLTESCRDRSFCPATTNDDTLSYTYPLLEGTRKGRTFLKGWEGWGGLEERTETKSKHILAETHSANPRSERLGG
eukprot:1878718-Prymnesium_polylepis.1